MLALGLNGDFPVLLGLMKQLDAQTILNRSVTNILEQCENYV